MDSFNTARGCIRDIAEFDGSDKSQLPEFIKQVETIEPIIVNCAQEFKTVLFSYIKNICVGRARQVIQNTDNLSTWTLLKDILRKEFGEKRKVTELVDELKTLQLNGTIEGYYKKIRNLVHKINNSILTYDGLTYSNFEINRIALHTFIEHLPEPTRKFARMRRPTDLDVSYDAILEAKHQHFTHNTNFLANTESKPNNNYDNNDR